MVLALWLTLFAATPSLPQAEADGGFPGTAVGHRPRVEIPWNRLYDYDEILAWMQQLSSAWPGFVTSEVIGRSSEGREMRVFVLNNPATGKDTEKPGMWVDGNVHGNEVQGSEAVVYIAWYLLENYGSNEKVTDLLDEYAFYLLPMVNPDGRASWFADAHTASSSRSGRRPLDSDRDGALDEDGPNDLDGDGHIVQMRKYVPGAGTHRLNVDDPRILERVPDNDKGIRGDYVPLGYEGLDDDGDGRINEDSAGGYDMNRAWPSFWRADHVQYGAGPYPLYWPETRCIADYIMERPNIAGVQSFHNAGGMILRGPGAEKFGSYPRADVRVYDEIGEDGERMLPFYRYWVIWEDLYTVYGGFVTWTYEGLGIISFTNELWTSKRLFPQDTGSGGRTRTTDRHFFNDKLLMGAGFIDWHPFDHPEYGEIEIGGFRKDIGRVPPTFLIEEMLHRNALFTLRHAAEMPRLRIDAPEVTVLANGTKAIDVVVHNDRLIPTRTARATEKKIGTPDIVTLSGENIDVLAGGFRTDRFRPERIALAEREPARLLAEGGVGGRGLVRIRWFVSGSGEATMRWQSEKARSVSMTFRVP